MSPADLSRDLKPLGEALRALPQAAPEPDLWPQLAARLARTRRRRPRRGYAAAALAAVLVLAVAAALLRNGAPAPGAATTAATETHAAASIVANAANSTKSTSAQKAGGDAARLAALQRHSQALEGWLHETARAAGPLPGQDLAAAAEIEDMIGLVDVQLGAAGSGRELALWRRRVALLEDLSALRYSSYSLAENGVAARAPVNWTN